LNIIEEKKYKRAEKLLRAVLFSNHALEKKISLLKSVDAVMVPLLKIKIKSKNPNPTMKS
jgi:hypothetical protein